MPTSTPTYKPTLSRERRRQLRRKALGLCRRKCDEKIFKSDLCEKHYKEALLQRMGRRIRLVGRKLSSKYFKVVKENQTQDNEQV